LHTGHFIGAPLILSGYVWFQNLPTGPKPLGGFETVETGILEYWSVGVMGRPILSTQYSITPYISLTIPLFPAWRDLRWGWILY